MTNKAVILLSGGLDSSTVLAIAKNKNFECYALTVNYGQRHTIEIENAKIIAENFSVKQHKIVNLDMRWIGGSALTSNIPVPKNRKEDGSVPITYVPARNTIMLSLALGWAEVIDAHDIFIGVNAVDYSGYPDCRPEFIKSFEKTANLATREGVEGRLFKIHAPLIEMSKAEIIKTGVDIGVDYSMTISCYDPDEKGKACGKCDACKLRREGFLQAKIPDQTIYINS